MFTAADLVNNAGNEAAILNIFNTNIIGAKYMTTQNFGARYDMWVDTGWFPGQYIGKGPTGNIIDIMSVNNSPANGAPTFSAYWCPYEKNDCQTAFLGTVASYMFTAKMDGCSFGFGSQVANVGLTVAHCNLGGTGHAAQQMDMIKQNVAFQNDPNVKVLSPGTYRQATTTGGTEATTFGILRANGTWKFYTHVVLIDKVAKTMQLVGTFPIGP